MHEQPKRSVAHRGESAINIFAMIGFVAILIIGLWSTIFLFDKGVEIIGSAGSSSFAPFSALLGNSMSVSTDTDTVYSDTPVTLHINTTITKGDTLTLTYPCRSGVFLKISPSKDSSYAIPCNAPFALSTDSLDPVITPVAGSDTSLELPITIQKTRNKDVHSDSVTLAIQSGTQNDTETTQPAAEEQTPTEVTPTQTQSVKTETSLTETLAVVTKDTKADLQIRLISIGTIQKNGQFKTTNTFTTKDTGSIIFEVTNSGTATASAWNFSAVLPTGSGYLYTSGTQKDLEPGAKTTLSMQFDQMTSGSHIITITVDPSNHITESDENNNAATTKVIVR